MVSLLNPLTMAAAAASRSLSGASTTASSTTVPVASTAETAAASSITASSSSASASNSEFEPADLAMFSHSLTDSEVASFDLGMANLPSIVTNPSILEANTALASDLVGNPQEQEQQEQEPGLLTTDTEAASAFLDPSIDPTDSVVVDSEHGPIVLSLKDLIEAGQLVVLLGEYWMLKVHDVSYERALG